MKGIRVINGRIFTIAEARAARVSGGWVRTKSYEGCGGSRVYGTDVRPASFLRTMADKPMNSGATAEWRVGGEIIPYREGRKQRLGL